MFEHHNENNTRTFQSIKINNNTYNYINFDNEMNSTVTGLIIPIDTHARRSITEKTNGFPRQLLQTVIDNPSVTELIILNITEVGMRQLAAFYFKSSNKLIPPISTREPKAIEALYEIFTTLKLEVAKINSLEYLRDNPDAKYTELFTRYYSPKFINDTGLYIEDTMIQYDGELEILNMPELVEKYNLQGSILNTLKPDRVTARINKTGLGMLNIIGYLELFRNGVQITDLEGQYMENITINDKYKDFNAYLTAEKLNTAHEHALNLNKKLYSKSTKSQKDQDIIIKRETAKYQSDLDSLNEPLKEILYLSTLLAFMNMGNVKII